MLEQKKKLGVLHHIFFPDIVKGLLITMRNMLFEKKVTIQYPEERRNYSDRFRGQHYIKAVNGVENCTACMLCPTVCPAECIHIEAGERSDKEKYPVKFEIDVLRCCFCGMCEEACPKDAIKLSNIYEMSQTQSRVVYDKEFLMEQRGNK
ncbi:MAG: NADH-quinone oxidoreductase subunit I [Bacteriovoracia bacterium]